MLDDIVRDEEPFGGYCEPSPLLGELSGADEPFGRAPHAFEAVRTETCGEPFEVDALGRAQRRHHIFVVTVAFGEPLAAALLAGQVALDRGWVPAAHGAVVGVGRGARKKKSFLKDRKTENNAILANSSQIKQTRKNMTRKSFNLKNKIKSSQQNSYYICFIFKQ